MLKRTLLALLTTAISTHAVSDDADMKNWIDQQTADTEFVAVAAALIDEGGVTHFFGGRATPGSGNPPGPDTQFEIGSITKSFTDLLLAEMVEKGLVDYSTTMREVLGDEITFANPQVGDITLLQLATHTSGLPRLPANFAPTDPLDPYKDYDDPALLQGLAVARAEQPLGDHYAYSNFAVGALGFLLGRVHGGGYTAAMHDHVIAPLGLNDTGFERAENSATPYRGGEAVKDWSLDAMAGAGSLRSTVNDLARLAKIMLGEIENPLAHNLANDREIFGPADNFEITRVWHVGNSDAGKIFWHNGGTGGFWSFFGFRPDTQQAAIILVSGDDDPTEFGLSQLGYEPAELSPESLDPTVFGQYDINANIGMGIYDIEGVLVGQVSGQPPFPLSAVGDDWYAFDVADASVHFIREGRQVVALDLAQNGVIQRATRSADKAATTDQPARPTSSGRPRKAP